MQQQHQQQPPIGLVDSMRSLRLRSPQTSARKLKVKSPMQGQGSQSFSGLKAHEVGKAPSLPGDMGMMGDLSIRMRGRAAADGDAVLDPEEYAAYADAVSCASTSRPGTASSHSRQSAHSSSSTEDADTLRSVSSSDGCDEGSTGTAAYDGADSARVRSDVMHQAVAAAEVPKQKQQRAAASTPQQLRAKVSRATSMPAHNSDEFHAAVAAMQPSNLVKFSLEEKKEKNKNKNKRLMFKITGASSNAVKQTLKRAGIVKTNGSSWNTLWGKVLKGNELKVLEPYQKVNHFPGTFQLGRKDSLARNVNKMRRINGPDAFPYMPRTFLLPQEREEWEQFAEEKGSTSMYIMKPNAAARGIGIKLVTGPGSVGKDKSCVVQQYINNPFLINGFKFDLRLYVAVTSFDPLRAYIFHDGLARFCTETYDPKVKCHKNRFRHLTNYSLQKTRKAFVLNTDAEQDDVGQKWSLQAVKRWMQEHDVPVDLVFGRIHDLIIKTLICADPAINTNLQLHAPHRACCFEVFGFDVLLDDTLHPWLMEVNTCPALNSDTPLDKKIKHSMMVDLYNMIGLQEVDKKKVKDELDALRSARLTGLTNPSLGEGSEISKILGGKLNMDTHKRRDVVNGRESALKGLTEEDLIVLRETEMEWARRGDFQVLYPAPGASKYLGVFEAQRYLNILLAEYVDTPSSSKPCILPGFVTPAPASVPGGGLSRVMSSVTPLRSLESQSVSSHGQSSSKISARRSNSGMVAPSASTTVSRRPASPGVLSARHSMPSRRAAGSALELTTPSSKQQFSRSGSGHLPCLPGSSR